MNTMAYGNKKKGRQDASTIYTLIRTLKQKIPNHTLLQYTATPQAPLFIDLVDELSPNFIELLTPGESYTGGKTFFLYRPDLLGVINDIEDIEETDSPPQSLMEALRVFFYRGMEGQKRT